MKICEGQRPLLQPNTNNATGKVGQEGGFQEIMEKKMSGSGDSESLGLSRNADPVVNAIQIPGGVEIIQKPSGSCHTAPIIEEIRKTLDLIEFYAEKLRDSSLSIEGLDPLVDHLGERLDSLRGLESASGLPGELKSILSDVVLTMGTEIARFKRGDYS